MNVKRKELQCGLGKVTVEEFHDGRRMHIGIIAEHFAPAVTLSKTEDEFQAAYLAAGIRINGARLEVRFSVADGVVMDLVQRGELTTETDIISALRVLAKAAWVHKNDVDAVWGHQSFVWAPQANTTSQPWASFTSTPPQGYGFDFYQGPSAESFE